MIAAHQNQACLSHLRTVSLLVVLGALSVVPAPAGVELFIADRDDDAVYRFDGETGAFMDVFCSGGQIDRPHNVEFGPDGHLYVVNFGPGNILKFDGETGQYLGEFYGNTFYLEEPVDMIFKGGEAYVLGNDTQNVVVLDAATGAFIREFGRPTMRYAHGFTFGPDGLLYITTENTTQGLAQVWDAETETLLDWFAPPNPLDLATGIAFGPDGNIFVADWWDAEVLEYDQNTLGLLGAFVPAGAGGISGLKHVMFRPDGYLYVSNSSGMHRFDAQTGAFVDVFIPANTAGMGNPRGFAFRDILEPGPGDLNCDGAVNAGDIDPFVLALTDPAGYAAAFPNCDRMWADVNADGVVNAADIDPFVILLTGP